MSDSDTSPAEDAGTSTRPADRQAADAAPAPRDARPAEPAPSGAAEAQASQRRPRIGDTMPAPPSQSGPAGRTGQSGEGQAGGGDGRPKSGSSRNRRRRRGRGGGGGGGQGSRSQGSGSGSGSQGSGAQDSGSKGEGSDQSRAAGGGGQGGAKGQGSKGGGGRDRNGQTGPDRAEGGRRRGGKGQGGAGAQAPVPVESVVESSRPAGEKRRRRTTAGSRAVGRYQMNVHVAADATHIAVLEGRSLIEHYVSRPADDVTQIHGNIYVGRVENVLPGMEAAFIDIATPKNAVLYQSDVQYDPDDIESKGDTPRIEDVLKARQLIVCQVTKNPIAHKGARLTQEVSLPGRFVVLVPNSRTYGISKRLPDDERKRLRQVLDKVKPAEHGVIVRTAAEGVDSDDIRRDVERLVRQWERIAELAAAQSRPALVYREPELAVRIIREEFNSEYRAIVIDDRALHDDVREYVEAVAPSMADRVQFYDPGAEPLPLFERYHVTEQLAKALDRKVWLPSGGSLIIEHTEALTVIDVNTGRNVGSSSLEETVFRNNLEAAEEIAHQLRLRDIGGIIVIDFVDMEVKENRDKVVKAFREALGRDKTRTQVFNISELGLVEMTRKRIGEGLLESVAHTCERCSGRGVIVPEELMG